jgi:hypothetical protein
MNTEAVSATCKPSSTGGARRGALSGWKCSGRFDLLPAGTSVCARCWNGKQR